MPVEMIIDEVQSLTDSGFVWRERDGVRLLVCSALERLGFANGFSTRLGGVSDFPENSLNLAGFDDDLAENIAENRRRFLNMFDGVFQLATVWQVHGRTIKSLKTQTDIGTSDEKADGLVSDLAGVLAGVKTADCVPVLICDPATGAYAAVHAGWRGTAASIVRRAIDALIDNYGCDPAGMSAAIGPAACGRNYEVGQDVIDMFMANLVGSEAYFTPTRPGHALVDLHRANHDQLIGAGLSPDNIFTAPYCTMERPDLFFSYRIDKKKYGKTGRLLSVIGRK